MSKVYTLLVVLLLARLGSFFLSWQNLAPGARMEYSATVGSEPVVNSKQMQFRTERFLVVAPTGDIHFGDQVKISGQLSDSGKLIASRITLVSHYNPGFLENLGSAIRSKQIEIYQNVLPYQEANLLSGVVLGSLNLDRQFKAKLAAVGVTHIIAASGMNITLFSGFVFWGLSRFRLRSMYKVILGLVFILLYSSVTGFESPIVRASLMVTATYLASLVGRQSSGFWGLLVAGYIMLWVTPALVMSASFLLSFFAMIGQIFLGSWVRPLPKLRKDQSIFFQTWFVVYGFLRNNFWQSFLAIVFTLPIMIWFFGKFSLISLLSNMLVLWTVEPLMILGGLIGFLGSFGNMGMALAKLVALPAGPLLAYFLWVVDALSKDFFLVNLKITSWTFPVGYYLILGGFVWWWQLKRG